jgi:hypothetical protein
MSVTELQWIVGLSVTVVIAIASIAIGAFRAMAARLDKVAEKLASDLKEGDKELARAMKSGDDNLHDRLNRVRDEYVPRRELDDHMARIDKTLDEIKGSQNKVLELLTNRSVS